jgi:hypothetical protein
MMPRIRNTAQLRALAVTNSIIAFAGKLPQSGWYESEVESNMPISLTSPPPTCVWRARRQRGTQSG